VRGLTLSVHAVLVITSRDCDVDVRISARAHHVGFPDILNVSTAFASALRRRVALIAAVLNERASPSSIEVATMRYLLRFGGRTILRLRSLRRCGYGTALVGRLLDPGRNSRDELQTLHRIDEASSGERLSRLHREHRSGKLRIFLGGTPRGELLIATLEGGLVLGREPLGFLGTPLHTPGLRIFIEPPKGDSITDAHASS
jgi:hypothetical protein